VVPGATPVEGVTASRRGGANAKATLYRVPIRNRWRPPRFANEAAGKRQRSDRPSNATQRWPPIE